MRKDMEEIYLQTFRVNLLKDSRHLVNDYLHVISEDTLSFKLAEEFIARDLIKAWELDEVYQRISVWQIIFWLVIEITILANNSLFAYTGYWGKENLLDDFSENCLAFYGNGFKIDESATKWIQEGRELKPPLSSERISLYFIAFLVIHLIDIVFYMVTKRNLDMWLICDPNERQKWAKTESNSARKISAIIKHVVYYAVKIAIMTLIYIELDTHKWCDPFRGIYFYVDFYMTIAKHFIAPMEKQLQNWSWMASSEAILAEEKASGYNHFYNCRTLIEKGA